MAGGMDGGMAGGMADGLAGGAMAGSGMAGRGGMVGGMPGGLAGGMPVTGGGSAEYCGAAGYGDFLCCGATTAVGESMTRTGVGRGSFNVQDTYTYVGDGRGDHLVESQPRNRMCLYLLSGVSVLLAIVLVVCLFPTTPSSTAKLNLSQSRDCTLWGDPHVKSFDGAFPEFLEEGEQWIVKSDDISIQARYLATPFTNGPAATHQIAIGGQFMDWAVLSVGPMDNGQITCSNLPILTQFPSEATCGGATVSYDSQGELVDGAQAKLDRHIVHFSFPARGLHLEIFRWANHINVRVTLKVTPGMSVDGSCGNANNDQADDTKEAIVARIGARIPVDELLFRQPAEVSGTPPQQKTIADCELHEREHAMSLCRAKEPNAAGVLLDACVFDVCFAGDQYAAQDAI